VAAIPKPLLVATVATGDISGKVGLSLGQGIVIVIEI
jgi:hypothetical protein